MTPGSLLNFASPYLILFDGLGLSSTRVLWPDSDITCKPSYLGALPLVILATLALFRNGPKSTWRWWLIGNHCFRASLQRG